MKLVALVESPEHVCCRYRLRAFEPAFQREGWSLELEPLARQPVARWSQFRSLRRADVVILQRRLLPWWQLRLLCRTARALVYDFDDAVFWRDSYAQRPESPRRHRRFRAVLASASRIVAGNDFLANHAARWVEAHRIRVIPTCVEPDRYPLASHERRGNGVELVWIGSRSTVQSLERSRGLLEDVGHRIPGLRLRVICDAFPELEHIEVVRRPWSAETEAAELSAGDIGISWLPDDRWSRGKCGLKVLQYMAAGLPVIANPVGVQTAMVRAGRTGFLAETADQWCDAVAALANDPPQRRSLGQQGRRLVEEHYSIQRWAPEMVSLLRGLAEGGGSQLSAAG